MGLPASQEDPCLRVGMSVNESERYPVLGVGPLDILGAYAYISMIYDGAPRQMRSVGSSPAPLSSGWGPPACLVHLCARGCGRLSRTCTLEYSLVGDSAASLLPVCYALALRGGEAAAWVCPASPPGIVVYTVIYALHRSNNRYTCVNGVYAVWVCCP